VYFKACNTTQVGNTCQAQATIDIYIDIDWFTVSPELSKVVDLYYQNLDFISYNGIVFDSVTRDSYLDVDVVNIDVGDFAINKDSFLVFDISINGKRTIYERKYSPLQTVLGNVGGLINVLILVINIIFTPSFKFKMYEGIINKLYQLKKEKKGKKRAGCLTVCGVKKAQDPNSKVQNPDMNIEDLNLNFQAFIGPEMLKQLPSDYQGTVNIEKIEHN